MYKNVQLKRIIIVSTLMICVYIPSAHAQSVTFSGRLNAGTGITTGKTDENHVRRSPSFLSAELRTFFDDDVFPVYSLEILSEIESRTTLGIVPKIEYTGSIGDNLAVTVYGGIHSKVAPMTMFGPEIGVYLHMDLGKIVIHFKISMGIFPWGDDLPDGTTLTKIDFSTGFSFPITRYGQ
ncbi:MAG: hypothetical protein JXR95_08095 [Deltaproteobacteria bacterium]|nr:hypothetical protein [Deltaproteobacteria bacterium]